MLVLHAAFAAALAVAVRQGLLSPTRFAQGVGGLGLGLALAVVLAPAAGGRP